MSMLQRIKDSSLVARKAGNKITAALLTTLYAEAQMVGKNKGNRASTDDEVIAVVRKFLKNNQEALAVTTVTDQFNKLDLERVILESYLPPELSKEQIIAAIAHVSAFQPLSMKSMSSIKAYIDEEWPGSYDGRKVSELLKERISGTT